MAIGGTESPISAWTSRLTPVTRGCESVIFFFLGAGGRGPAWPKFMMSRMSLVEAILTGERLWVGEEERRVLLREDFGTLR
jgi:hypothetical protein